MWLKDAGAPVDLLLHTDALARHAAAEDDSPTMLSLAAFGTVYGLLAAGMPDLAQGKLALLTALTTHLFQQRVDKAFDGHLADRVGRGLRHRLEGPVIHACQGDDLAQLVARSTTSGRCQRLLAMRASSRGTAVDAWSAAAARRVCGDRRRKG